MTANQERFCREMAVLDERRRYRAHYVCYMAAFGCQSERHAKGSAVALMKIPEIRERIAELRAEVDQRLQDEANHAPVASLTKQIIAKQERIDLLYDLIDARKKGVPEIARLIEDLQNERINLADERDKTDDPERIKALNERLERIEERIETFIAKVGLGEETGLLVRDIKGAGGIVTEVVKFDRAVLEEIRALENDVAELMGMAAAKKLDLTSGGKAFKALVGVSIDDV